MNKTLLTSYKEGMQGVFYLKMMEYIVYLVIKTKYDINGHFVKQSSEKKKHYEALTNYIIQQKYEVSLEELSGKFYMSRYYICHLFKEVGGMTIKDFMNKNRIEKAQELLEYTNESITAIADQCGYETIEKFGRNFRNYIGVSPSEYRKRHRSINKGYFIM